MRPSCSAVGGDVEIRLDECKERNVSQRLNYPNAKKTESVLT